jgi:hypothetical protein
MNKLPFSNWKVTLIYVMVFVGFLYSIFRSFKINKAASDQACATVKMALSGVITEYWGRNYSSYIRLDNCKNPVGSTVKRLTFQKGFERGYSYKQGDSVIKSAGSELITFKRGDSIATYILECKD